MKPDVVPTDEARTTAKETIAATIGRAMQGTADLEDASKLKINRTRFKEYLQLKKRVHEAGGTG